MRAIVAARLGGPDVLVEREMRVPVPGPGQVLVQVAYAGLNFSEVYARRGQTPGFTPPFVPGLEVAGAVAAVGAGVSTVREGDPVAAFSRRGGYADYAIASEPLTFRLPSDEDGVLIAAAGFPTTICTAWLMLRCAVRLGASDTLLVHAAAGALGLALAGIARHVGVRRVIGTTSTPVKADFARAHGYDDVFLRGEWVACARETGDYGRIDAAVETVGGGTFRETLGAMAPLSRIVACGDASWTEDVAVSKRELWMANRAVVGFNIGGLAEQRRDLYRDEGRRALAALLDGAFSVPIDSVVPLNQVRAAHARLEQGQNVGKLIMRVAGGRQ